MVGLERGTVELEPHQEQWAELYSREAERLRTVTDGSLLELEHIGSTAVEGLPAKPIIDILATVADLSEAEPLVPVLEDHGYEYRPEDVEGRVFLARGPRANRTVYLSITEKGSDFHEEKIAFRDYLREHPEAAEQYALLKERLADQYPNDREKYTAEKTEFVQNILGRAMSE
jgi:GrpB-like predicted nucleotidyltransferase (UPF0157 family)